MQDLIAGRINYLCDAVSSALPQIKSGTVKPLAVLARHRSPVLPDVPTAQEQGLAGFEANMKRFVSSEIEKWAVPIKASGVSVE